MILFTESIPSKLSLGSMKIIVASGPKVFLTAAESLEYLLALKF
jgi:hypothetical protein